MYWKYKTGDSDTNLFQFSLSMQQFQYISPQDLVETHLKP